jgi:hypothetical protein
VVVDVELGLELVQEEQEEEETEEPTVLVPTQQLIREVVEEEPLIRLQD